MLAVPVAHPVLARRSCRYDCGCYYCSSTTSDCSHYCPPNALRSHTLTARPSDGPRVAYTDVLVYAEACEPAASNVLAGMSAGRTASDTQRTLQAAHTGMEPLVAAAGPATTAAVSEQGARNVSPAPEATSAVAGPGARAATCTNSAVSLTFGEVGLGDTPLYPSLRGLWGQSDGERAGEEERGTRNSTSKAAYMLAGQAYGQVAAAGTEGSNIGCNHEEGLVPQHMLDHTPASWMHRTRKGR